MIRIREARLLARELHDRYEPMRAVVLVSRRLHKAIFAGRADDVVFWALVFAHYRGGELSDSTNEQLSAFRKHILPDNEDEE